jgi:hypothetical protein
MNRFHETHPDERNTLDQLRQEAGELLSKGNGHKVKG